MKIKTIFLIGFVVITAALAVISIAVWQKDTSKGELKSILKGLISVFSEEEKAIIDELTTNVWIGYRIEMPGLECRADEKFGSNLRLTFDTGGTCAIEKRGEVIKAKWSIDGNTLFIRGGGIHTNANYNKDTSKDTVTGSYFMLYDIERYSVLFKSEMYLDEASAQLEELRKKRNRDLEKRKNSLDTDI